MPKHIPDILDCLAQLSNDEVPTPPTLARAMLDILPEHVWSEPNYRWLDPVAKSGSILREIATRLLVGLKDWEPDFAKRRDHIFRNMLFGQSITEITGEISRRSLYCSHNASGPESIVHFTDPQGNLPFVPASHTFKNHSCTQCGAADALERGATRENHAYSFIHGKGPAMKFDVIIGNPPYQTSTNDNGTQAKPLYHYFVEKAISMDPRYLVMIIPSRWFTGGMGLDSFRTKMIDDRRIVKIIDNPKLFDCFPGVEIKGGVNYFLWSRNHDGDCEFSTRINGAVTSVVTRDLRNGQGVVLRDNLAASFLDKTEKALATHGSLESVFAPMSPFGDVLKTNFTDYQVESFSSSVPLIFGEKVGYIRHDQVQRRSDLVNKWKVLLPLAGDGHGRESSFVLGEPIAISPGSVCTMTYLLAGVLDTREETENYAYYLSTKFVRFLVHQRKSTQHTRPDRFRFVPALDMKRRWTDEDLYAEFGLTQVEIEHIEKTIAPRVPYLSLDSCIPESHLPGGKKFRVKKVVAA